MAKVYEAVKVVRNPRPSKLRPNPGAEQRFDVEGCLVWPRASNEEGKGWVQISGYGVLFPAGSDIVASDQVLCRGELHSVVGKPGDYGRKGIIVTLERVAANAES